MKDIDEVFKSGFLDAEVDISELQIQNVLDEVPNYVVNSRWEQFLNKVGTKKLFSALLVSGVLNLVTFSLLGYYLLTEPEKVVIETPIKDVEVKSKIESNVKVTEELPLNIIDDSKKDKMIAPAVENVVNNEPNPITSNSIDQNSIKENIKEDPHTLVDSAIIESETMLNITDSLSQYEKIDKVEFKDDKEQSTDLKLLMNDSLKGRKLFDKK